MSVPEPSKDIRIEMLADLFWYTPKLVKTPFDGDVPDETVLMRYMNEFKFLRVIKASKLYLSREDDLRHMDCNEGRETTATLAIDESLSEAERRQRELRREVREENWVKQTFTSCWYMGDQEKEEMHREYIGDENGVVFYTTVGCLRALCNGTDGNKQATIAPIRYVNWLNEQMEEHGDYFTMLYKDAGKYSHECELRFMVRYTIGAVGGRDVFWNDEWPRAERIPVDVDRFITKVVVAPQSRPLYLETVQELLKRHGYSVPVVWSTLGTLPRTDELQPGG
jgi:hypothetical protein